MPDEDDKRVAGPDSGQARQETPAGPAQPPDADHGPRSGGPAPDDQPPSAGQAPPADPPPQPGRAPGRPQAAFPVPPPPGGWKRRGQVREWGSSRPLQLLVAGVVGALIGGGAVGLLDVLDDDGERYIRVIDRGGPHGPGWRRWDREPDGDWYRRMPPEMQRPRQFPPPPTEAPAVPSPSTAPTG